MQVTVDLNDLETIIYATAAIKQVESALASRRHDPFVKTHLEYMEAHNNLVAVMNGARRAEAGTAIPWDGELSKEEIAALKKLHSALTKGYVVEITADARMDKHSSGYLPVDDLASKGCVKIGQCVKGAIWPGQTQPDLKSVPQFAVMITPRGVSKLEAALRPPQKELNLEKGE